MQIKNTTNGSKREENIKYNKSGNSRNISKQEQNKRIRKRKSIKWCNFIFLWSFKFYIILFSLFHFRLLLFYKLFFICFLKHFMPLSLYIILYFFLLNHFILFFSFTQFCAISHLYNYSFFTFLHHFKLFSYTIFLLYHFMVLYLFSEFNFNFFFSHIILFSWNRISGDGPFFPWFGSKNLF